MRYPEFKLCVRCCTYNQSQYILDALNGFCIQNTDFPFVCCVIDDASTDGEQGVIKEYLTNNFEATAFSEPYWETDYAFVYFMRHKTNINCYFAVLLLKINLNHQSYKKNEYISMWRDSCEYQAVCEGDDYWIEPMKLRRQVGFLDMHSEHSMCFHAASIKYEDESLKTNLRCQIIDEKDYLENDVFSEWIVPTASIVYKTRKVRSVKMKYTKWFCRGDLPLILRCMKAGKVHGMSDIMSVYRVQNGGESYNSQYVTRTMLVLPEYYYALYKNFPALDQKIIKSKIVDSICYRNKLRGFSIRTIPDLIAGLVIFPEYMFRKLSDYFDR